jgi:hypothetical protein
MNRPDHLERELTDWLSDTAAPLPAFTNDVLRLTAGMRQRSRRAVPERWLPMTIILRRPVLAPPMRVLAVGLALLVAVGATVAAATLLSRLLQLPAVVTLEHARGLVAFERDGAVWTFDPESTATERIVDDAHAPVWSPDGDSLFFWRPDGPRDMPMVLDMTTSDATPVALADTTVYLPTRVTWGPDGTVAAAITVSGLPRVAFLRVGETATGPLSTLPDVSTDSPAFQPETDGTPGPTLLYRAHPTGIQTTLEMIGSVREQTAPSTVLSTDQIDTSAGPLSKGYLGEYDLIDPDWAPPPAIAATGAIRPIAYHQLHDLPPGVERAANGGFRVHIFDGTDRVLEGDANADDEGWPLWDPTGERVAFLSYEDGTDAVPVREGRLVIMPAHGDRGQTVMTAPINGAGPFDLSHAWSPDGTQLLLVDFSQGGQVRIVDAATGAMELLPIISDGSVDWVQPAE